MEPPSSRFRSEGIEERCTIALTDSTDYGGLVRVLNEHDVEEVFHLGAQTIVGTAYRSPLSTWEGNVHRVVVASSDKAPAALPL